MKITLFMSETSKIILVAIAAMLIGGGIVYFLQAGNRTESTTSSSQKQTELQTAVSLMTGAARYNCELSGGSFTDGVCECPLEEGLAQTQEMMYDKGSGFCQTTHGGHGGDAFAASVGFPYGDYAYFIDIVQHNCKETGGEFLYFCICADNKSYDKSTGYCK
jgi:hypothetical protein